MFKIYFYPIKGPLKPNTHFKVNAAHLSLLQPFFFLTLSTPLLLFHSPSSSAPIFSIPISHSLLFSLSLSFSLAFGSHPDTHVRRSWCYIMFFFPTGTHSYATWWSPALPLLPAFPSFFLHTITAVTEATKDSLISQERMVCSKSGVRKSWISSLLHTQTQWGGKKPPKHDNAVYVLDTGYERVSSSNLPNSWCLFWFIKHRTTQLVLSFQTSN